MRKNLSFDEKVEKWKAEALDYRERWYEDPYNLTPREHKELAELCEWTPEKYSDSTRQMIEVKGEELANKNLKVLKEIQGWGYDRLRQSYLDDPHGLSLGDLLDWYNTDWGRRELAEGTAYELKFLHLFDKVCSLWYYKAMTRTEVQRHLGISSCLYSLMHMYPHKLEAWTSEHSISRDDWTLDKWIPNDHIAKSDTWKEEGAIDFWTGEIFYPMD